MPTLTRNLMVLHTRETILALAPMLQQFAKCCGQPGAMHWLPYFLHEQVSGHKAPYLVLQLRPEQDQGSRLTAEDLVGATLFFEYRVLGIRTGAVATGDAVGFNSVIAPRGSRSQVAAIAAEAMVARGARLVLATYEAAGEGTPRLMRTGQSRDRWGLRQRSVGRMLRLAPTLDETLARMGKATRFNLRYYRRRLEKQMQMEYVPDAGRALRGVNLQALNAASLNPIEPGEFARRVQAAANLPESFLVGLRSADGTWLSLIGGWRQGTTTVLHWQMNRAGYEKHSLGTVMRSFFLENEIAHGATDLFIYGGTPHSMRHAFDEQPVADLVLQRRCWTGEALRRASGLLRRYAKVGGADFLLECLHSSDMQWTEPGKSLPRDAPKLLRPAHGHKVA